MNKRLLIRREWLAGILSFILCLALVFSVVAPAATGIASADDEGISSNPYVVRTFVDEEGREIAEVIFPGRPPEIKAPAVSVPEPNPAMGINILSNVPAFDWCYGCSATSAAMMCGYYDNVGYGNMYAGPTNGGVCPMNNAVWGQTTWPSIVCGECPLSATHQGIDGLVPRGHVDDYWIDYGNLGPDPFIGSWPEHTHGDCTADYMGTNQSNFVNSDGATTFYWYLNGDPLYDYIGCEPAQRDGCHGVRLFAESRGYTVNSNFSQAIKGQGTDPTKGFTFANFCSEIDAGRPVLIQVTGHTMLGYGYDTAGNIVYIHDTWDYNDHQMTWGGIYSTMQHEGVTVMQLEPVAPVELEFGDAPDPTYPSLLASDGARHNPTATEILGLASSPDSKDFELDANVPDLDLFDDGLLATTIGTNNPSQTVTFEVTDFMAPSSNLRVNILIDLNADGDWSDAGEHVVVNQPITTTATGVEEQVVVSTPFSTVGATLGPTWLRITLTRADIQNPPWDGTMSGHALMTPFEYGETEDWEITLTEEVPDITVDPTSFEVTLPSDTTWDDTLTIGNVGSGSLTYDISDEETTGTAAPGLVQAPELPQGKEEGPIELIELSPSEPMSFAETPLPFGGAQEEIAYDDGGAEDAFAWFSAGGMFAVRFTPSSYPVSLETARVCFWDSLPDSDHEQFGVEVYDDDGAGGTPGTQLGTTVLTTASNWGWWDVGMSGLGITITEGDFYVAYEQLSALPDCEGLCADETAPDGRSWSYDGASWSRVEDTSAGPLDWMIRCVVEQADCPWLSESPTSGSVAPSNSDDITVSIDTTGLAVGDYTADIVIANNDPDENPTIVPVTLHVSGGLMEGDASQNGCVSIGDAMFIAQYRFGDRIFSADQLECADTTDNGIVTMGDAMHIAQWLFDPDGSGGILFEPLWKSPDDDHMLPPQRC